MPTTMETPAEGVVVDLDSRRPPKEPPDLLSEVMDGLNRLQEQADEIADEGRNLRGELDYYRTYYGIACRRVRELKRDLLAERQRSFPFTADDVLAALRRVYSDRPVSASEVANGLGLDPPTHSQSIRTGLTLSGLSELHDLSGRRLVVKHPANDHYTHRWSPIVGGDDA